MRITCIVIVLPPLTTSPARRLARAALARASGSTPGCHRKRLSSAAIRAAANLSGTALRAGKRHWPSDAMRAPRSDPSRASRTEETGSSKRGSGRRVAMPSASTRATVAQTHAIARGRPASLCSVRRRPAVHCIARRLPKPAPPRRFTARQPTLIPPPLPPPAPASPWCARTPTRHTSLPPLPSAGSSRRDTPR